MNRIAIIIMLTITVTVVMVSPAHAQYDGLVSCWSMDEQNGVRADSIGTNHLKSENGIGYMNGMRGNAAAAIFDGDEALVTNDPDILAATSFTWVMWFRVTEDTNGGTNIVTNGGFSVLYVPNQPSPFWLLGSSLLMAGEDAGNEWVFVAISHDAGTDENGLFVDSDHATNSGMPPAGTSARIAGDSGAFDNVAFFDRALSSDEIATLYNYGAGLSCDEIAAAYAPLPTPTSDYDIDNVDLPSGKSGAILYSITSGDVATITMLSILLTLLIYWLIRDHVQRVGVHSDTNK